MVTQVFVFATQKKGQNYPLYGRLLPKIFAPGAHVLNVRSAPSLNFQQYSTHILNSLPSQKRGIKKGLGRAKAFWVINCLNVFL